MQSALERHESGVQINEKMANPVSSAKPLKHAISNTTNVSAVADRELHSKRHYDTSKTVDRKLAAMHITRNMKFCAVRWEREGPATHRRHPQGRCFVSDRFRFVFVLIPKAGSSTGRELSLRYGAVKTVYSRLTLQQRGYFTFAFWRDPVSRLESAFTTILNRARDRCESYEMSASDPADVCEAMFTPRSGFDRFVRGLPDWGVTWDEHIRPQRHYLALSDGSPMRLDLLAHIKDTADAWLAIAEKLGFDPPLHRVPHARIREGKAVAERLGIRVTHSEETANITRRMYNGDYCCFNQVPCDGDLRASDKQAR